MTTAGDFVVRAGVEFFMISDLGAASLVPTFFPNSITNLNFGVPYRSATSVPLFRL